MPAATIPFDNAGTFRLGTRTVKRIGYGAMRLSGPRAFGPPKDRAAAVAVLRAAVDAGVDHIDTSDYYGPHVVNQVIREALHPYRDGLVIVTKVGGKRGSDASFLPAMSPAELTQAVHDNLSNLGLDVMDVVNLRCVSEDPLDEQLTTLAELQRRGLIRHIGLSNVTPRQVEDGRRICEIVCVQNLYHVGHRKDDAFIDRLAKEGTAYVPFAPLGGGLVPLPVRELSAVAALLEATPTQVALAWLLQRSPNVLLIPGTSSLEHLRENLAATELRLPADAVAQLDGALIAREPRGLGRP